MSELIIGLLKLLAFAAVGSLIINFIVNSVDINRRRK